MNSYKKQKILLSVLLSFLFGVFAFTYVITLIQKKELAKNPVYTMAVIIEKYIGAKGKDYVRYKFEVDGVPVIGNQGYYPFKEKVLEGDSCYAVYVKTNYDIHRLLVDEDGLLRIKREKPQYFKLE